MKSHIKKRLEDLEPTLAAARQKVANRRKLMNGYTRASRLQAQATPQATPEGQVESKPQAKSKPSKPSGVAGGEARANGPLRPPLR
jgi:hypothetical protein